MAANVYIWSFDWYYRLKHSGSLSFRIENEFIVIVSEVVAGRPLAYQPMRAAKTLFIDVCDHLPPTLPKIEDQKSLSLC
jgi:hypothetical protein